VQWKLRAAACSASLTSFNRASVFSRAQFRFRRDRASAPLRTPIYNFVVPSFLLQLRAPESSKASRACVASRFPRFIIFPSLRLAPRPRSRASAVSSAPRLPKRHRGRRLIMALPYLEAVLCKSPPPSRSLWCSSRSLVVLVREKTRDPCLNPRVWESRGGGFGAVGFDRAAKPIGRPRMTDVCFGCSGEIMWCGPDDCDKLGIVMIDCDKLG
jgi:hypothetical protein